MKRVRRKGAKAGSSAHLIAGLFFVGLLLTLLVLRFPPSQGEARNSEAPLIEYNLKLNGPISTSSAGSILAVSDGLFQREGLRILIVAGSNDKDAISAVVADENTIGLASAAGFLRARAEGLPVVALAGLYITSSVEFFSLPGTKLQRPSDLEGTRIGYKPEPEFSATLSAFIAKNSVAQSRLQLIETDTPVQDLLNQKIGVMMGHREIEGVELERLHAEYQSLSPDSFGIHYPGPLYFSHERALSKPRNLQKFLIATASGWNAAYADYDRTIPILVRAIDTSLPSNIISHVLDEQRRFLRPFGTRFGELDSRRLRVLQAELLQRRIIQEPVDFARAINYDVLKETYRREVNTHNRTEP
jgi:putative hydroxymethylpyrimidine transport system substrate-binding protein